MQLLFLTQTYPRFPGDTAGPFIRDLARALVRGGDGVRVLVPHAKGVAPEWDDDGVAVRSFRYGPERSEVLGYSRSLEADERLRKGALTVAPLYALAARRAVSKALVEGPCDLVHAHWVVPNGIVAAASQGVPVLAVGLHGSDVFLAERRFLSPLMRWTLRRTRLLTGCSPELVERVRRLGFEGALWRVIPYGVDTSLFSPDPSRRPLWRSRLGIPEEALVLLSVGRMVTKKGFHVLAAVLPELLERLPELHVVLAGAGDLLPRLETVTAPYRSRVHLPGSVGRETLPDLYRAADIFVLPAVHDAQGNVDGLPNVILEAMASGLPVVATEVSGIPLAVSHGVHGSLIPEGESGPLVDALVDLFSDPDLRRRTGAAGRDKAVGELTWDAVAARYREGYQAACEARSSSSERAP